MNTAFNAQPLMVAPGGIIKCFEAACSGKSFREGVAVEMEEFTKLVPWPFSPDLIRNWFQSFQACRTIRTTYKADVRAVGAAVVYSPPQVFSVQSAALRHLFLAERMAQKVPGVNEKPAPLKKIGILGAGLMGGGIAMCFVQKGVPVVLKDAKQEWLDDGMKKIQGTLGWSGQAGPIEPGQVQAVHEPSEADARLCRLQGCGHGHRGGAGNHGPEEGGVPRH